MREQLIAAYAEKVARADKNFCNGSVVLAENNVKLARNIMAVYMLVATDDDVQAWWDVNASAVKTCDNIFFLIYDGEG